MNPWRYAPNYESLGPAVGPARSSRLDGIESAPDSDWGGQMKRGRRSACGGLSGPGSGPAVTASQSRPLSPGGGRGKGGRSC